MLYDDVQALRHRLRLELEQEDRCTPVARMLVCLRLDRASPPAFFFAFLKFVAFPCSSNPICVQNYFPICFQTHNPRTMRHRLTLRSRRLANSAAALLPKKRPNRPPNLAPLLLLLPPPPMARKVTAAMTMTATAAVRFLRVVC